MILITLELIVMPYLVHSLKERLFLECMDYQHVTKVWPMTGDKSKPNLMRRRVLARSISIVMPCVSISAKVLLSRLSSDAFAKTGPWPSSSSSGISNTPRERSSYLEH